MSTEGILLELMEIAGYSRKFRSSKSKIQPTGAKNSVFYIQFIFKTIKIYHESPQKIFQLSILISVGGKVCHTSRHSTQKLPPDSALEQWVPYRQMIFDDFYEHKIFKNYGIPLKVHFYHALLQ